MKTIPCEALLAYLTAESLIKTINGALVDAGCGDIRLALAKGDETPKLSIVDNVVQGPPIMLPVIKWNLSGCMSHKRTGAAQ